MTCNADSYGIRCNMPAGHTGDHWYKPYPNAVAGITWPQAEERKPMKASTNLNGIRLALLFCAAFWAYIAWLIFG